MTNAAMRAQRMIETNPVSLGLDTDVLTECIEAAFECAQACTACADACLNEGNVEKMRYCIRTNLDCADICETTGRMLSRQTQASLDLLRAQLGACLRACQECGEECRRHGDRHEHCAVCGEACRQCEKACDRALNALSEMAATA